LFVNKTYRLRLEGELAKGEVSLLLDGLGGLLGELGLGEGPADSAGLLLPDVLGRVLLALVQLADLLLLLLVVDGEDASDLLADALDLGELGGGAAGHLGDAEGGELTLELVEGLEELVLGLATELEGLDRHIKFIGVLREGG